MDTSNNSLIPVIESTITMSSREIAELTGKRHDHVMRDIETQLIELIGHDGLPKFGDTYQNQQNGQVYRMYRLPKRECLIVVSGYSVELRARIIDRLMELEAAQQHPVPQYAQHRALTVHEQASSQIEQELSLIHI